MHLLALSLPLEKLLINAVLRPPKYRCRGSIKNAYGKALKSLMGEKKSTFLLFNILKKN